MNSMQSFEKIIEQFGGWPILDETTNKTNLPILDKLILLKRIESSQFIDIFVSSNPKDPKHNILRVAQPSWFFSREYIFNEEIMQTYSNLALNTIKYLNPLNPTLREEIKAFLEIETQFALV